MSSAGPNASISTLETNVRNQSNYANLLPTFTTSAPIQPLRPHPQPISTQAYPSPIQSNYANLLPTYTSTLAYPLQNPVIPIARPLPGAEKVNVNYGKIDGKLSSNVTQ